MKTKKSSWLVLIAISLGVFMAMLDVTIVNVALPTIQAEFHTNYVNTQWVVNAYTASYTVALLIVTKLGDMLGKKRFFLIAIILFTLGSLFCSIAPNDLILNLSRGLEGIGGAGILGLSMALIGDNYSGKQRTFILGIWGSIIGFGTSIGPLIGGILVQYFNWRSIFMINIPIGLFALIVGHKYIRENYHPTEIHFDLFGMLMSTLMVLCLVMGLLNKEDRPALSWISLPIGGWLIAGFICMIIFIIWELRQKYPMMDLHLFKNTAFVGSCIGGFMATFGLFSFFTYLTILMQDYMGYSPLAVGEQRIVISIFPLILGPVMGAITGRMGSRNVMFFAMFITGAGLVTMNLMLGFHNNWLYLLPAFVLMGLGNAAINPSVSNAALLNIKPEEMGMASGTNNVCRQFGNCLGILVQGIIVRNSFKAHLTNVLPANHLRRLIINAGPFSGREMMHRFPQYHLAIHNAYYLGIHHLLIVTATLFILAAFICYFLVRKTEKQLIK